MGEWCEMWISFWACWPVLMFMQILIQRLPLYFAKSNVEDFLLPGELDRAFIIFIIWLQFWRGSLVLHHSMRSVLSITNVSVCLGNGLGRITSLLLPGKLNKLLPCMQTVLDTGSYISRYRSLSHGLIFVVVGVILVVLWTCYHAISLLCQVITLLILCFVAMDSANVVLKRSEDLYIKRLSFWVLLQIWTSCSQIPMLGSCLQLATPLAINLFYLGGDHLVLWLLIPCVSHVETSLGSLVRRPAPSKQADDVCVALVDDKVEDPCCKELPSSETWRKVANRMFLDAFAAKARFAEVGNVGSMLHSV